jgi:hypothetical protein
MGDKKKMQYYAEQLRLAPNAKDPDFVFDIETVLDERKIKGVDSILVKYMYYPCK